MNYKAKKTAEFVSFVVSSVIIMGLFIYLIIDHSTNQNSPYLDIQVNVQEKEIRMVGKRYIIPVQVHNSGDKTPTKTTFKVSYISAAGTKMSYFEIDYLSKNSSKKIYLSTSNNPKEMRIELEIESYQF